jgi:hypothetical protein
MPMTEAEWLAYADPEKMLEFLRGKASDRKLRLFACGCSRHVWDNLPTDLTREAVETVERVVDGLAERYELDSVWRRREYKSGSWRRNERGEKVTTPLANPWQDFWEVARDVAWETARLGVRREGRRFQAALLCCVMGNPFCPSSPLPSAVLAWNDRTIPRLAQAIYEDRKMPAGTLDPGRLAILADALLDGGCDDEALMQHCRGPGPHVRGCWAVDLILGKA